MINNIDVNVCDFDCDCDDDNVTTFLLFYRWLCRKIIADLGSTFNSQRYSSEECWPYNIRVAERDIPLYGWVCQG